MNTRELFDLSGRVAIVTGGAGLLGREHAMALADCGATVVLADVDRDACQARAKELERRSKALFVSSHADVSNPDSVREAVGEVHDRFGRIDVLVNNAAAKSKNFFAPFEEFPFEDWNRVMAVNVGGMFLFAQAVGKVMLRQGSGSVINVASIYGLVGPDQRIYEGTSINTPAVYSASKAAVLGLTRYLAAYWADKGIRVNAITPGGVFDGHQDPFLTNYSRRVPMGRMANPGELRGAIAYLASDASSYVTGHNLVLDGGWTVW
jgi:NAD(P)-dependent dehydrogenase (short-subunit alcohol dehydrogenase family)